jgi:uncharacterized membrane protein/quercetin dioxygenase-like cupin family protein
MQNIAIIITLLLLPYWILIPAHLSESLRGRVGVALVFAFAGVGHFIKTSAMTQMLPAWVPMRVSLIYITGAFELLAAVAVLITPLSRHVGLALCVYLLLILPSNIYAAVHQADFGGHAAGPVYLLIRIPLQLLLIGWIYWFAVRQDDGAAALRADDAQQPEIVSPTVRKALLIAKIEGSKLAERVEVKEIELLVSQEAGLHLHPCPVVGHVVEGEIAFQIEGQPEKILKAGDAFLEPANARILRFDNIGPVKAKFVAFYLLGKDDHELIKMIR